MQNSPETYTFRLSTRVLTLNRNPEVRKQSAVKQIEDAITRKLGELKKEIKIVANDSLMVKVEGTHAAIAALLRTQAGVVTWNPVIPHEAAEAKAAETTPAESSEITIQNPTANEGEPDAKAEQPAAI